MKKGFTLIELLVVIAIIGILSSVVLASLNSARSKGRDASRVTDIKQMQLAMELYYDSCGEYPSSLDVTTSATGCSSTLGDFMNTIPTDPQDSTVDYGYTVTSDGQDYVMQAELENAGHTALEGDADTPSVTPSGFSCTDPNFCVQP